MQRLMTRKILLACGILFWSAISPAQDKTVFNCTVYNSEYNLYIVMNFYDKDVTIKGQEYLGEMDGYIGDYEDFRKWLIVGSEITAPASADIKIINDEGSEDLKASVTCNANGTYTFKQVSGSSMKVARKQKWQKLPRSLVFTKTREEKGKD